MSVLHVVEGHGRRLVYRDEGEGPPIVFVHGLGDDLTTWDPFLARLSSRRRCIALDLRAHGASGPAADYDVLQLRDDVASVVDHAKVEQPTLVGHSLGGFVATHYATTRPVRAVVCVDQILDLALLAGAVKPVEDAVRHGDHVAILEAIIQSVGSGRIDAATAQALAERRRKVPREVMLGTWGLLFRGDPAELARAADYAGVRAPFVAVTGNDPGPAYAAWLAERIAGATLEVWPGGGHYPHLSEPERFAALVERLSA
jgi:pimeloyl-ACP methyl ester carboxylesterase